MEIRQNQQIRQASKPTIRVTQLENFRRYMTGEYDYITEQSVVDNITGSFQGNTKTRIGTAFHSIVETGKPDCYPLEAGERHFLYYGKDKTEAVPQGRGFNIDGYSVGLDIDQCKVALEYRNEHPDAFHEFRVYKDYGDAIVTGCADMIDGTEIHDIKTKFGTPDDDDYIHSAQWKLYCEMFGADIFVFDLFIFNGYKEEKHGYDVRGLELTRHEPIKVYRYPGMEQDNHNLLHDFLEWATKRNLIDKLIKR